MAQAAAAREAIEQQLRATASALEESRQNRASEAQIAAKHLAMREAELGGLLGEAGELRHALESRLADAERERVAREAELQRLSASYDQERHASQNAIAQIEQRLRSAEDDSRREIANLQRELNALRQAVDVTTAQRDALRKEADRVPLLQGQLDLSQNDNRRRFEDAPYAMCRFSRDGRIEHVNRSLVELLGYRKAEDLRKVDFATAIFESADDLLWLIERSVNAETLEMVETTWRRKDRSRLVVRLHAAAANDWIEIVAEDITNLRSVEDRLRQAQRMEAVGRLASEVAVTCDNLLRSVTQDGRQWLAEIGSDTAMRHQGEQLLGEVTRAAGFLRQLGVYGKTQVSALEPVNVNRVLKDMEAVTQAARRGQYRADPAEGLGSSRCRRGGGTSRESARQRRELRA